MKFEDTFLTMASEDLLDGKLPRALKCKEQVCCQYRYQQSDFCWMHSFKRGEQPAQPGGQQQ